MSSPLRMPVGEVVRRLRRDGVKPLAQRAVLKLADRLGAQQADSPIAVEDIVSSGEIARVIRTAAPALAAVRTAGPQRVAFVIAPPGLGSGGHTTLFRMVAALAARGHRCTLALYDPRRSGIERHRDRIAAGWPWLGVGAGAGDGAPRGAGAPAVEVVDAHDGLAGFDAVVASSWQSAHVAAGRAAGSARLLYFIQDFEPYFYPRGALYALAEDTYRFGMANIALGHMVDACLAEIGAPHETVPFGLDTAGYGRPEAGYPQRRGVTAYVRIANDRRGYLLARAALERFHALRPEQPIHVYGDTVADWPFPAIEHGHLTPAQLDALYRSVCGGLALSFTNVSLIAGEMLASGARPVLNDHPYARADLPHPDAVWAEPTPAGLAAALAAVVERAGEPVAAADTVDWALTAERVAALVEGGAAAEAAAGHPRPEGLARHPEAVLR